MVFSDIMEVNISPVTGNKARKRLRNEKLWKRNLDKLERYVLHGASSEKMWIVLCHKA